MTTTLAVLGATGRAGRLVVEEALARGWRVRAIARDPSKLPAREGLEVVKGEVTNAADVVELVKGCDAVVSALGIVKGGRGDICSTGTTNALAAMKQHGVKRYVVVGGAGSRAPGENKPLSGKLINVAMKAFMGDIVRDKEKELALLATSDVDWTVVRPPVIADGDKVPVRVGDRAPPAMKVPYAALAAFIVDEVEARRHVRKAPYVSA